MCQGVPITVRACFNEEAWDFGFGKPFTGETEEEILDALAPDYIEGLTLLGGEALLNRRTRRRWCLFWKR